MATLNTLEDLFHHQLKDIYSAEQQLIQALPDIRDKVASQQLHDALTDYHEESREHKKRLDHLAKALDIDLSGGTCRAMEGLIREARSFASEDAKPEVRDAGIIADVQRIQHYEISAYGTTIEYATALDHPNVMDTLQQTLNEVGNADQLLNGLAKDSINEQAKV